MSALFRWMMRGQVTGHNWEKQEWVDARDWGDELLATFTSGIWSQMDDSSDGYWEESRLCEIGIQEGTIVGPWKEIPAIEFQLSQLLKRNKEQHAENAPSCLTTFLELLETFWKYGVSQLTRSSLGFHCVDDVFASFLAFLRNHRNAKTWQGFGEWAANVESVIEKTRYLSKHDWSSKFSDLIESL